MAPKKDAKTYIVDASVLASDPNVINALAENNIVVPIWVIEELDRIKRSNQTARHASRIIDQYDQASRNGSRKKGSLKRGVRTQAGGMLYVDHNGSGWDEMPISLEHTHNNRILLVALNWQKRKDGTNVIILSRDTNLRIKASSCGILAEDWHRDRVISSLDELYTGTAQIPLRPDQAHLLQELHRQPLDVTKLDGLTDSTKLLPNQCCWLLCGNKYQLALHRNGKLLPVHKAPPQDGGKVAPRNDWQAFAYYMLKDPEIGIITLAGDAGTGKTLMTLLAAFDQIPRRFNQIQVFRRNIEADDPLGFRPGDLDEKFDPFTYPIRDNLELLFSNGGNVWHGDEDWKNSSEGSEKARRKSNIFDDLVNQGILSIQPLNFLRGRSLNRTLVYVDDAQNLTREQVQLVGTRVGQGTKIVFGGDPTQVDDLSLSDITNGFVNVVESFRGDLSFGHITLLPSERSEIAEKFAKKYN